MKRKYLRILIIISIVSVLSGCNTTKENSKSVFSNSEKQRIPNSMGPAIFEYANEENNGFKLITGEVEVLTSFFNHVVLEKTDLEFSEDWMYRITYTNSIRGTEEKIYIPDDADTFVILVGETCMQINGETYTAPKGTDFSGILEVITGKYEYFDYKLYYP